LEGNHNKTVSQLVVQKHTWLTISLWLPSNEMFNSATGYIVISANIKRRKSDSSCFATTETGICLVCFTGKI